MDGSIIWFTEWRMGLPSSTPFLQHCCQTITGVSLGESRIFYWKTLAACITHRIYLSILYRIRVHMKHKILFVVVRAGIVLSNVANPARLSLKVTRAWSNVPEPHKSRRCSRSVVLQRCNRRVDATACVGKVQRGLRLETSRVLTPKRSCTPGTFQYGSMGAFILLESYTEPSQKLGAAAVVLFGGVARREGWKGRSAKQSNGSSRHVSN